MRLRQRVGRTAGAARRRGSALVLSLVAVGTVVVLAASFTQFASAVGNRQTSSIHKKRSFYLAEAGLAEAFAAFSCGRSGNVGSMEEPARMGDGLFWVEATELVPGIVKLESTGMVATGRAVLSLVAKRGKIDVAALGVFSSGPITLGAGSMVDAYDSSLGSYDSQTDLSGASIASNDGITVSGTILMPTTIDGDVTPGPEATVTTSGSVTVTGSQARAFEHLALPEVEVPELSLETAKDESSPYPLVIPPGKVGLESLTVRSGSQAIIQGPAIVVLGSLLLESSAQLEFDTSGGAIELYVTDSLVASARSILSTPGEDPALVLIQVPGVTAAPIQLRAQGSFHAVVYAPEAEVVLGAALTFHGSLVADALTLNGAAKLHFDRHLAELSGEEELPTVMSWRLVELGSLTGDLSADPFDALGLDPTLLPKPVAALEDQLLDIHYYDATSVYHQYTGVESAFDWNVVTTVIEATLDGQDMLFPRSGVVTSGVRKAPGVAPIVDGPMI
jgi:hypothetical protein